MPKSLKIAINQQNLVPFTKTNSIILTLDKIAINTTAHKQNTWIIAADIQAIEDSGIEIEINIRVVPRNW